LCFTEDFVETHQKNIKDKEMGVLSMLSIEKAMESSQMGYTRHKVVYDESGKPIDYIFISLNLAFEWLTGLKKKPKSSIEGLPT